MLLIQRASPAGTDPWRRLYARSTFFNLSRYRRLSGIFPGGAGHGRGGVGGNHGLIKYWLPCYSGAARILEARSSSVCFDGAATVVVHPVDVTRTDRHGVIKIPPAPSYEYFVNYNNSNSCRFGRIEHSRCQVFLLLRALPIAVNRNTASRNWGTWK